jgi:hypothetical protein
VQQVLGDKQVQQELLLQEQQVQLVHKDLLVHKVQLALREIEVQQVLQVLQAQLVHKDPLGILVLLVLLVLKELPVLQVLVDSLDRLVLLELQALLVHR